MTAYYPKIVTKSIVLLEQRILRDHEDAFDLVSVSKHVSAFKGFGPNVHSLYANGLTSGAVWAHIAEIYDTEISRNSFARVEVIAGQSVPVESNERPSEPPQQALYLAVKYHRQELSPFTKQAHSCKYGGS
jgi:transposase-like protein